MRGRRSFGAGEGTVPRNAGRLALATAVGAILALPWEGGAQGGPPEGVEPYSGYVGVAGGGYVEVADGHRRTLAGVGSIVVGLGFERWTFEGEIARAGEHCEDGSCHAHALFDVGVTRRFGAGPARPFVTLGCCVLHAGAGIDVPVGRRFAVAPAVDLNWWVGSAGARFKLALLRRF